jgi:hypothetical protein
MNIPATYQYSVVWFIHRFTHKNPPNFDPIQVSSIHQNRRLEGCILFPNPNLPADERHFDSLLRRPEFPT